MTSLIPSASKDRAAHHVAALRLYVQRVFACGESLTPDELADMGSHMSDFLALGSAFNVTEKEMVSLIYRDILVQKRGCDCHSCRARREAQLIPPADSPRAG